MKERKIQDRLVKELIEPLRKFEFAPVVSVFLERQNAAEEKLLYEKLVQSQMSLESAMRDERVSSEIISRLLSEIPRETDFAFVENIGRQNEIIPISGRTHRPVEMYGGDEFEYQLLTSSSQLPPYYERDKFPIPCLSLRVGERNYPFFNFKDKIRIAGPIGVPMETKLIWSFACEEQRFDFLSAKMKITIHSTDQTRFEEQVYKLRSRINKK